jgi:DNA repair ATPase RecN
MIKQVKIKEFKNIRDFDANFDNSIILLRGDNEVGKSSVIQFIEIALGKQKNIPPGSEGQGLVIADFKGNEYLFAVEFKSGKPVVTITFPDGMRDNKKSTLAGIVGAIDFDIDKFVEQSKSVSGRKEQIQTYKSFLDKQIVAEIERYEVNVAINYEQRTIATRDLKNVNGVISLHPMKGEDLEIEPIDVSEIFQKQKEANEHNSKIDVAQRVLDGCKIEKDGIETQIKALTIKLKETTERIEKGEQYLKDNQKIDVSEYENKLQSANEVNQKVEQAKDFKAKIAERDRLENEIGEMTALIDSTRQLITDSIRDMDSPVEGLTFDAEQLLYNGIAVHPDSLSKSTIMELGIKLKIAENPDAGVLFIQEGESIGLERLETIKNLAEKNGFQIIMEQVERGNPKLTVELVGT